MNLQTPLSNWTPQAVTVNMSLPMDIQRNASEIDKFRTMRVTVYLIANVLGLCAIVLNIGFITAMCHSKDSSLPYHRFMKGLSIADILASIAFLLQQNFPEGPFSYLFPTSRSFITTSGLPYIFRGFPWVFFTAYFLTLTCLSVNQYIAVCKPWKYSNLARPKIVYMCLLIVWLLSCLQIFIPILVVIILNANDDALYAQRVLYVVSRIEMQAWMVVFILSTIVNITLNSMMYQKIRELKWKRRLSMNSQETLNIRMKQEAFITICLLLITAILLRLPFPIVSIISLQAQFNKININIIIAMQLLVIILLYTNFFADPIIYIVRMREAREFMRTSTSTCLRSFRSNQDRNHTTQMALMTDCNEKTDITTMAATVTAADIKKNGKSGGDNVDVQQQDNNGKCIE